jgi:FdhE protein
MQLPVTVDEPWAERRRRTAELVERYPFASEVLTLYAALLDVQEPAFAAVRARPLTPSDVVAYATRTVLPQVVAASAAAGPEALRQAVLERREVADLENVVARWLRSEDQPPVDRYLARASAGPVLEALGVAAGAACIGPGDEWHCPCCGGPPQLSYFTPSRESLVTGLRHLVCARCSASWPYPRLTCAACGERSSARLPVFTEEGTAAAESTDHVVAGAGSRPAAPAAEQPRFPHIGIDGCESCGRYLLRIDLARDARAVPIVDELAAIPLDLYAKELGMTKVAANLMGF